MNRDEGPVLEDSSPLQAGLDSDSDAWARTRAWTHTYWTRTQKPMDSDSKPSPARVHVLEIFIFGYNIFGYNICEYYYINIDLHNYYTGIFTYYFKW